MRWIKAKDRMPLIDNDNPKHYVFRNIVNHRTINIYTGFINSFPPLLLPKIDWEWLDESPIPTTEEVEQEAQNYALKNCWGCKGNPESHVPCTCHDLEAAFIAGASLRPSPVTVDIVEALEKANPYKNGNHKSFLFELDESDIWDLSCAKLRELIKDQPAGDHSESEKDLIIHGLEEGSELWKSEYDNCRAILQELVDLMDIKDTFGSRVENHETRKPIALVAAKKYLSRYQHL